MDRHRSAAWSPMPVHDWKPPFKRLVRTVAGISGSNRVRLARDVAAVVLFVFGYFFIRGLMHSQQALAVANGAKIVHLERFLGVFWEPSIQHWTLAHNIVTNLADWIYIWGHWPVIAVTLIWLLVFHRRAFGTFRNAMLLSGAAGLVIFATFPVAPPRLMPGLGFVDIIALRSHAYRVLQPPSLADLYAAMPSLHVGWNLLMGIAIAQYASRRIVKLFGVLLPIAMYLSVVATANHYILDGLAGSAIAATALALVVLYGRINSPGAPRSQEDGVDTVASRGERAGIR